jgi:hypothetical protein
VSSQLLEYEVWNRIHAYGLGRSHANEAQALLIRVDLIEMTAVVLAGALEPFPTATRTLEALHLSTIEYVTSRRETVVARELRQPPARRRTGAGNIDRSVVIAAAVKARLSSFDDLVGAGENRGRDGQAERLGGLEIDHQLQFGRLLHG